ncbi:TNT domain-containing protein [Vogesella sp. DC21W]|uniref:TNT domain-containing protein n=1 Tax=Vogesella aquatica TaxID=2984206 RepID=A0ABT5IYA9_9NEIS|nr:TNT domain-containing protein [Vogesella aquatica]MDC7717570.1 TNT domain-containing protein [Vogesella aquatica]
MPARLIGGLQSDNPEVQGRALTELLAGGVGGAKVIGEVRDAAVALRLSRAAIEADAIKIKARLVEVAIHRDDHRFDAVAEKMAEAKAAGWKDKNGHPIWPPENGKVLGTEEQIKLPIGTELDRYGLIGSNTDFIAPKGVPYANRALPLGSNSRPLVKLVVLKPLPVEKSLVMSWFGEPGMGVQYQTTAGALRMTVGELIEHGYLRRVD